jgi:flagellar biosynthesis/type III secretory pathway protein FliH
VGGTPDEAAAFEAFRATIAGEEVTSMQLTWADRLEAKGREEGLREGLQKGLLRGRQEGRQEGRLRSLKDVVLRLLAQRFGRVPAKVRRRIEAIATLEPLERIAGEILTVHSLADLKLE